MVIGGAHSLSEKRVERFWEVKKCSGGNTAVFLQKKSVRRRQIFTRRHLQVSCKKVKEWQDYFLANKWKIPNIGGVLVQDIKWQIPHLFIEPPRDIEWSYWFKTKISRGPHELPRNRPPVHAKYLIAYILAYKPPKSTEDPSNLPIDPLKPCRPSPWSPLPGSSRGPI